MSTVIFVGPTLARDAIQLDADLRGPIACGDVLRAMRQGYDTIAIIDGSFDHALPVWHKEILWALNQGKQVWGAASMGALRAAELHTFGMRGVGAVFESFRDGLLEHDDEIAIAHADASHSYRASSEALVNIRATLHRAMTDGVFDRSIAETFIQLARGRFYPERSFERLLEDARRRTELGASAEALRTWLGPQLERRIDQQTLDATALINALRDRKEDAEEPSSHPFAFAYTEAFHELLRRSSQS